MGMVFASFGGVRTIGGYFQERPEFRTKIYGNFTPET